MRCPQCGSRSFNGEVCVDCDYHRPVPTADADVNSLSWRIGSFFRRPVPPHRADIPWRSPLLAAVMGSVVIGSGHLYVRKYLHGLVLFGLAVTLTWAIISISFWALFILTIL